MSDYLFRTVVWQKDLEGLAGAGLIGLAPSNQHAGAQLFVPSLYEQGAIKRNMFSMFIDPNEVSKIQIGGYDLKKYAKGPLRWYPISSPSFWQLPFDNVKLGSFEFTPSVNLVMADTGTSLNMIPDEDYYKIFNMFFKDKFRCQKLPNTLDSCDCTASQQEAIPAITFQMNGDTYSIPTEKWFERSGNQCVIKFMHSPRKDYWILGLNFFENYYTVFDYENMSIGFADSVNQGKKVSKSFIDWATGKQTVPALMNLQLTSGGNDTKIYAFVAMGGFIMFAAYFLIMKKYKNSNKIRAQVEHTEYFVENVREDDRLSGVSQIF